MSLTIIPFASGITTADTPTTHNPTNLIADGHHGGGHKHGSGHHGGHHGGHGSYHHDNDWYGRNYSYYYGTPYYYNSYYPYSYSNGYYYTYPSDYYYSPYYYDNSSFIWSW